ncbi:hypothetical protein SLEP1_g28558 [Rubroshorea leprosula]|uniref:Uncharacterized protein n=1 Tax=Rubroshorea leprosula TaxID=152421 RepID=A0AAV5K0H3_9ROSI|nr:hypothetical protein SLEP1_g28558 [Rubroshorea leprosula]
MYVTRRLSTLRRSPSAGSLATEGPTSGFLVIQDEEAEAEQPTLCFGLCKDDSLNELPFPQNKELTVHYSSDDDDVDLVPVLNQPLSSNTYYAIEPHGRHKGEAYASNDEEETTGCCTGGIKDAKPRPLDPYDVYQQFEICSYQGNKFYAKSIVADAYPPNFLRRKGWTIGTRTSKNYELGEAQGLDASLRACLPDFNFPLSRKDSGAVVVGRWYCPFMFIKDGQLKEQKQRSMYYEIILEQQWEQIFSCENGFGSGRIVAVDVVVQKEAVVINGEAMILDGRNVVDGVMWFRRCSDGGDIATPVGLHMAIVERMKWEQEGFGWVKAADTQEWENVKREEEFGGTGEWRKFGCYVLVERYVVKRMDGSLLLNYNFKHTNQIRSKWE